MENEKILIVDDEKHMRFFISETLQGEGYETDEAENGEEAVEKYRTGQFALVIMDITMPKMNGIEALQMIREINPNALVIMITAHDTRSTAVESIKEGAYDYFSKPFDIDEMRVVVRRAIERFQLQEKITTLQGELETKHEFCNIIGSSREMNNVFDIIKRVGNSDVTVLIHGESGTGKELIAKAIHYHSPVKDKPFIAINCAAIPENLLESELFGHEKGSFTGAVAQKRGKFEQAQGGTLFLDEIGDMSFNLQAKILRVLQEKEFERVGGRQIIESDCRIIAATNRDLAHAVKVNEFRMDLYYRLNVVPIILPPLRERKGDIPLLLEHFVKESNSQYSRNIKGFASEVMETLVSYTWPGNVRELENLVHRAVVLAKGDIIKMDDLPLEIHNNLTPSSVKPSLGTPTPTQEAPDEDFSSLKEKKDKITEELEKNTIIQALEECKWRRGEAADKLGMSRRTLLRKMTKYGL